MCYTIDVPREWNRKEVKTMRIVKKETVYLSANESNLFMDAFRMFEGIIKESESPSIKFSAECIMRDLQNFANEYCDFEKEAEAEEENDFFFVSFD